MKKIKTLVKLILNVDLQNHRLVVRLDRVHGGCKRGGVVGDDLELERDLRSANTLVRFRIVLQVVGEENSVGPPELLGLPPKADITAAAQELRRRALHSAESWYMIMQRSRLPLSGLEVEVYMHAPFGAMSSRTLLNDYFKIFGCPAGVQLLDSVSSRCPAA